MKILVVGDRESEYIYNHFDYDRFGDVDFVISSGDLNAAYLSYIVTMLNVPLYYVPGNHDSQYVSQPPEGCINIDRRIIAHKSLRIMGIGGSRLYNGGSFQFTERQMYLAYLKMKARLTVGGPPDILVTHAPAYGINDANDLCHKGFKTYKKIVENYNPCLYIHGHQHLTYGHANRVTNYNGTIIINSYEYYLFDYNNPLKKI